jgi:lysyl-tRNA synthetase class I
VLEAREELREVHAAREVREEVPEAKFTGKLLLEWREEWPQRWVSCNIETPPERSSLRR